MNNMKPTNVKNKKCPRVPRLRFPEFLDGGEWEFKKLSDFIKIITPPKKLLASEYQESGLFPIVDQSQKYIAGWTNDKFSIIDEQQALIIFGDHTCILKLIDSPFAQGADGIKIFSCSSDVFTKYTYQYLLFNPIKMEEYKRHFSILKEKGIAYPNNKIEQQKIVDCLSSLDERIAAETSKLDRLKEHKKGLLKQLFPENGVLPSLRFPKFNGTEEWKISLLGQISKNLDNMRIPITENMRIRGSIPYYGASGIVDYVNDFIFDDELLCISEDGANLIARTSPIAFSISGKSWVNNHAHVLKFSSRARQKLTEEYINFIKIDDFLTGMAQPKLNKAKLEIIPIPLPSTDKEEQKIAECLSSLNELITAQTQKIDLLKDHKKGLMQQLFPRIDEFLS